MPSLTDRLKDFFRSLVPTSRITRFDTRQLPSELASSLDVDRVLGILRSAEGGDCTQLFALYRDILLSHSHLQGRFGERKEAVVGDSLNLQAIDKKSQDDLAAVDVLHGQIKGLPSWEDACIHLLDSTLWPVSLVEKIYRPAAAPAGGGPRLNYDLAELVPVPHDLLDFRLGRLQIRDTDDEGRPLGTFHDPDPNRYIVHRAHTLTTPDNWGGPMRSLVFWWLLGTMTREWWGRFLDRYGAPFMVGKYDQSDDASRSIMERAFSLSTKLGGLVVSRETDVEIKQASTRDAGEAFETFHRICNEEISKLILGQTLSSDAKATGMGSGVAKGQGEMRQDKRQSDARRLGASLRQQLFVQFLQINGLTGSAPMAIWGTVSPDELKSNVEMLVGLARAGLQVADPGLVILSERFGLPIERSAVPAPAVGFGDKVALNSAGLRLHSAAPPERVKAANESIMRATAVRLASQLGADYKGVDALVATSKSPEDFLQKLETYCASMDPIRAADILEAGMSALAANGCVSTAVR